MAYTPWPSDGCLLAEAFERTADVKALQRWQAIAPQYRKLRVISYGPFNEEANERIRGQRLLNSEIASRQRELEEAFRELLFERRLVAVGRQGSLTAAPSPIPYDIWPSLTVFNHKQSAVGESRKGGLAFFAVRFFPVVKAPNRASLLSGLAFADAFRRYVLSDPEVQVLGKAALKTSPEYEAVFVDGRASLVSLPNWDVNYEIHQGELASILEQSEPDKVLTALAALRDRFAGLIDTLRADELEAVGLPYAKNYPPSVPPTVWSHQQYYVEATEGDLIERAPDSDTEFSDGFIPRWRALVLKIPTRAKEGRVQLLESQSTVRRPDDSRNPAQECEEWLVGLMEKNPNGDGSRKEDLWAVARERWGDALSYRAFKMAWTLAVRRTGAVAWSRPGRRKKSER